MNTAPEDSALVQAMLGRWIGSSRGQTFDYTFHPKHYFTLTIQSSIEPLARIYGYWDVRDHALHIGASDAETDSAPLEISDDSFTIVAPGGHRSQFRRQLA